METQVSMAVSPEDILIGDLIRCDGRVARVVFIFELWTGTYKFIVNCRCGHYNYIYDCPPFRAVTLLSI